MTFVAWLLKLVVYTCTSANIKLKRTAASSRGFLAIARLSCYSLISYSVLCGRLKAG